MLNVTCLSCFVLFGGDKIDTSSASFFFFSSSSFFFFSSSCICFIPANVSDLSFGGSIYGFFPVKANNIFANLFFLASANGLSSNTCTHSLSSRSNLSSFFCSFSLSSLVDVAFSIISGDSGGFGGDVIFGRVCVSTS